MAFRGRVAIVVAGMLLTAVVAVQAPAAPKAGRLVPFGSCAELLGYVKARAAPLVTPYGLGQPLGLAGRRRSYPAARALRAPRAPPGVDYSGTNVQEAGVDEPDLVKTNGTTLFSVENGQLEAVDVARRASRSCSTR